MVFGPRLPAALGRTARRPAPDRVRIVVDEQDPPARVPRALDVRAFERPPASVAGCPGGQLRLAPTRVALDTGEDVAPARAGVVAGPVLSSQAEAAPFAEGGSVAREVVGDVNVVVEAPAVEAVVAHVEALGRGRGMRLRVRLFAGSHPDHCCGSVGTRGLVLHHGNVENVGDSSHVITVCSELASEEVVWVVLRGGRWNSIRRTHWRTWWTTKGNSWGRRWIMKVLGLQNNRVERMQDSLRRVS